MDNSLILNNIKKFMVESFFLEMDYTEIPEDVPILNLGIDSMDFFKVLDYIKAEFGVSIMDGEINIENLGTIGGMCKFITEKQV